LRRRVAAQHVPFEDALCLRALGIGRLRIARQEQRTGSRCPADETRRRSRHRHAFGGQVFASSRYPLTQSSHVFALSKSFTSSAASTTFMFLTL
jgi:hypothetical protein